MENQGVNSGETAYEPIEPIKDGALFEDWHLVTEGILAPEAYSFATPVNKSIGLKANWSYSVTFDSNGGNPVEMQWVSSGGKAEEPQNGPYRNGYGFDGWYRIKADGEPEENPYDFETAVTESLTLAAKWIPVYFVGFDRDDGESMKTVSVRSGETVAPDRIPADPVREGFRFGGWHLKEGDGMAEEAFALDTEVITGDTILIAKWIPEYTVTFVSDGGTPSPAAAVVEPGKVAEEPAAPKKGRYDFLGWHRMIVTEDGTSLDEEAFDFSEPITESITLQAKWELTRILDLPAGTVSVRSGAFTQTENAQAIRLPGSLTDFDENSFDADLILIAPADSEAAGKARDLGYLVEEE